MRTRSKRIKTVNNTPQTLEENNNFDQVLPLDLVIEILGRLPLKSLVRFLTVSKLWETAIYSRGFVRSFPFGSPQQPRTLIALGGPIRRFYTRNFEYHQKLHFFSASSSSSSSSSSSTLSLLSRVTCPVPYPRRIEYFYHHVNGLISIGCGQEQIITNPTTGQSKILPRCKTRRKVVKSFFGYDSVEEQYKVLCMTERLHGHREEASSEHQVLTLGAEKESWRMIACSTPHRPWSNGVCIDGFVYYIAKTGPSMLQLCLMRFDLRSQKFDRFTSLPAEIPSSPEHIYCDETLITYQGKLAITTNHMHASYTVVDVWVLDQDADQKHEWFKKITFSTQFMKNAFHLRVRGVTHTGDFILAPSNYSNECYVVHYNPATNRFIEINFRIAKLKPPHSYYVTAFVFSDYVESARLLSKRQRLI